MFSNKLIILPVRWPPYSCVVVLLLHTLAYSGQVFIDALTSSVTTLSVTPCMLLSIRFSFRLPFKPRVESQDAS